eukprot:299597-Chlamydomonas_euryale.AAC.3
MDLPHSAFGFTMLHASLHRLAPRRRYCGLHWYAGCISRMDIRSMNGRNTQVLCTAGWCRKGLHTPVSTS